MKAEVYFVAANLILDKHLSSDVWFSKTFLEEMMVFIHYSFYAGLFETVIHNRFAEEMEMMDWGNWETHRRTI